MDETRPPEPDAIPSEPHTANPGYVLGQLARALTTNQAHPDAATRERAAGKIVRWQQVLQGMLAGTLAIGSRTPLATTPPWATLEVVKGGFATGALLAEGPLQPHELALLQTLPATPPSAARAAINAYYLSDTGFAQLADLLASGHYRLNVPEEGALLVIAWLAGQGRADEAWALLDRLGQFVNRLRFYPLPAMRPYDPGTHVFRQDVGQTITDLHAVRLRRSVVHEREAILVWAPLYDRTVALFGETVVGDMPYVPLTADGVPQRRANGNYMVAGGWPCQHYPPGWAERAAALLEDYQAQRATHQLSAKPERPTESFTLLRGYLARCSADPAQLTGREVGQIRALLAAFVLRRGAPGSPAHTALRQQQTRRASAPTVVTIAQVLIARLAQLPRDEGLDDLDAMSQPITAAEASTFNLPAGQPLAARLVRTVERSLAAPVEVLVARAILPSGEALARVVPQISAQAQVASVADPDLRRLYSALYSAFRRRRSLLLFNLQHQVTFDELPWVKALEPYRTRDAHARQVADMALRQVVSLAMTTFPQQILPNTLLREIRALAESAGYTLPIVDEVAADIFMGTFSEKYLRAAQWAGRLLAGSLYERYYGLSYAQVLSINDLQPRASTATSAAFDRLCHDLAGVPQQRGGYAVARNGTIIEQEQILTTHNLAVLFDALGLTETLAPQLPELARRCFVWVCAQQQVQRGKWKSNLRMLKNTAYAWRQMIFFLALLPDAQVDAWLEWAETHLAAQPVAFQERFRPALDGLTYAVAGDTISPPARRFLGWVTERHWLMPIAR